MILLDTNAVLWLIAGHRRGRPLEKEARLYLSPVSLLEIQFLLEVGKVSLRAGRAVEEIGDDPRWTLDSPPSDRLFASSLGLGWTRDPFDRLLVAHATCRRWRFATGDGRLVERLGDVVVAL